MTDEPGELPQHDSDSPLPGVRSASLSGVHGAARAWEWRDDQVRASSVIGTDHV